MKKEDKFLNQNIFSITKPNLAIESGQFGRYDSKQESPSYFRILDVFNKNLIVGGAYVHFNYSLIALLRTLFLQHI